jgi:hypothetical protein
MYDRDLVVVHIQDEELVQALVGRRWNRRQAVLGHVELRQHLTYTPTDETPRGPSPIPLTDRTERRLFDSGQTAVVNGQVADV